MSKKETIEDKVKSLEAREKKLKLQLDSDSEEMTEKAKRIGKIALISGIVAILGYWIFNVFFSEEEDEEKPKKKKKRSKKSGEFSSRITALAMPYLNKVLDNILDLDEDDQNDIKDKKDSSVKEEVD